MPGKKRRREVVLSEAQAGGLYHEGNYPAGLRAMTEWFREAERGLPIAILARLANPLHQAKGLHPAESSFHAIAHGQTKRK